VTPGTHIPDTPRRVGASPKGACTGSHTQPKGATSPSKRREYLLFLVDQLVHLVIQPVAEVNVPGKINQKQQPAQNTIREMRKSDTHAATACSQGSDQVGSVGMGDAVLHAPFFHSGYLFVPVIDFSEVPAHAHAQARTRE
jgi:hypothetical protein